MSNREISKLCTSCMSTSGYNFVLETFDSDVSCLTEGIDGVVLFTLYVVAADIQLSSIVGKVVTTHCQVPGSNGEDVDDVIDTILVIASRNTKCGRSSLGNTRQSVIIDSVSYDQHQAIDRRFDVSATTRIYRDGIIKCLSKFVGTQFSVGNVRDDLLSDITSMVDNQDRLSFLTVQVGSANIQSSSVINLVVATMLDVKRNSVQDILNVINTVLRITCRSC